MTEHRQTYTPDDLIAEYHRLNDFVIAENKRFAEHLAPTKTRLEDIKNQLLALLNEQKLDKLSGEHGTAYISTLLNSKFTSREDYLDFCLDNWDTFGNEALQIGAPQVTALRQFLDTHDGTPPPGVEVSFFRRVNINRS